MPERPRRLLDDRDVRAAVDRRRGDLAADEPGADHHDPGARPQFVAEPVGVVRAQLRADRGVPYGRVAELIGIVQKAGLTRIGFVTEAAPAASGS